MSAHPNLADPAFEPSDEQFTELTRAAFAHLAEARREADERLAQQIAELRIQALARLGLEPRRK
jgi:hypothetical protein